MQLLIYIFILELCFGFNGKLLVLGGISIRHWLFAVVLVLAYAKALVCFIKKRNEKKSERVAFFRFLQQELASFSKFDWVLLGFVLLHSIWIIFIPCTKLDIEPDALRTALSSGLSISLIALYFPAVYLLRNGQLKWKKYRNFVIGCFIAVAVLHLVLYVLERIQWEQNHTYYFMERVFDFWERLVNGHCETPQILMPKYTVRIIYGFNILIPISFYFIIGQKKKGYVLWALLGVAALFATGTRALIVGTIAGVCVFLLFDCLIHKWNKETVKNLVIKTGLILIFAIAMDSVMFRGMNVTRLLATFSVSQEVLDQGYAQRLEWDNSEYTVENELRGTANSNTTRILQLKELVNKFMEHPWFGHGFTLTAYDMQGVSYIAKVGLAGVLLWAVFLVVLLHRVIRMERRQKGSALPALYLVAAVLVDVMLQSMFGSITMAMAVFLFLDLEDKEIQMQVIEDEKEI